MDVFLTAGQKSLNALAEQHGINPKTMAKWKKRTAANDLKTGPKQPKSTVLTIEDLNAMKRYGYCSRFPQTYFAATG
jgi:transposase-like protein